MVYLSHKEESELSEKKEELPWLCEASGSVNKRHSVAAFVKDRGKATAETGSANCRSKPFLVLSQLNNADKADGDFKSQSDLCELPGLRGSEGCVQLELPISYH